MRQCPNCGKYVPSGSTQCSSCRETLPAIPVVTRHEGSSKGQVRRGLLYMFLAAVIHYFVGGYSGMTLPIPSSPIVTAYLSPLLFLSGLGLVGYGFYLSQRT